MINIKKKFIDEGYVVIRNLFPKKKINKIIKEIENLKKKVNDKNKQYLHRTPNGEINTMHNLHEIFKKNYFIKVANLTKLKNIIKNLLNDKVEYRNIEFFLKPKQTGLKAPYHQDNYYWNIEDAKALNVWIACTKSSLKNGGLIYLKGSHKMGTIKHQISYMPGSSQKINDYIIKNLKFKKVCPILKPGDCIIHHCEVIHGSNENKSNNDRIGLAISYKTTKSKYNIKKIKNYKKSLKKNLDYIYS